MLRVRVDVILDVHLLVHLDLDGAARGAARRARWTISYRIVRTSGWQGSTTPETLDAHRLR